MIPSLFAKFRLQKNANKEYYYPENELAFLMVRLLLQKTLTAQNVDAYRKMGFHFEITGGPP